MDSQNSCRSIPRESFISCDHSRVTEEVDYEKSTCFICGLNKIFWVKKKLLLNFLSINVKGDLSQISVCNVTIDMSIFIAVLRKFPNMGLVLLVGEK